ncbi:hypothetical protein [Neobacillus niacini]|uniref:hypothetical protein n=1 Tax=Neobacillus niacini TaxID=86668 RepID=UPI00285C1C9E|nr:hypothetical protein [Neobacillus niacini]MDR7002097.1 hypothetical protein [Neobacillus niacini]
MNKLTKGALTMVLVGAVTFSVANALLPKDTLKQIVQGDFIKSGFQKPTDHMKPAEKKGKVQKHKKEDDMNQAEKTEKVQPQQMAYAVNQTEKSVKDLTSTTEAKDVPSTRTNHVASSKTAITNGNKDGKVNTGTQKNSTTVRATYTTASIKPKTASTKPPATNTTMNSNAKTTGSTSKKNNTTTPPATSNPTATTNHGQQVSQDAKERAVSRQDQKTNN